MKRWSIAIVIALVVAVPLVIAACGSSSDEATPAASPTPSMVLKDIVDTAVEAGDFTTLVSAVTAADLVETLKGEGPYTVFAPTDAAFAALLTELGISKAELLADTALLTAVLTYHVLPARAFKADIVPGVQPATVQGGTFSISAALAITDGRMRMAGIAATDVLASNGVIHVIDKVILPAP
jgi:uncharacterized surface protein with fasciclin (FAS1) repeats